MTTLELKDAKTVPDPIHTYPKNVRNSSTPIVIDNGKYIYLEIGLYISFWNLNFKSFPSFIRVVSVSSWLSNTERTIAYFQEFSCKTKKGTWQKGNSIRAGMYKLIENMQKAGTGQTQPAECRM